MFQVFALAAGAPFSEVPGRREFIETVLERAIGVGCLIGTYERAARTTIEAPESVELGYIGGT